MLIEEVQADQDSRPTYEGTEIGNFMEMNGSCYAEFRYRRAGEGPEAEKRKALILDGVIERLLLEFVERDEPERPKALLPEERVAVDLAQAYSHRHDLPESLERLIALALRRSVVYYSEV